MLLNLGPGPILEVCLNFDVAVLLYLAFGEESILLLKVWYLLKSVACYT